MSQVNQGESSGGPSSVQSAKRRRGRPRKDRSLNLTGAAHAPPPGPGGARGYLPQRDDRTVGIESVVGQAVTGFVESTIDSGYLLTVRIGESNTNLRGIVFKPGHYAPITGENNVAPHVRNLAIRTGALVPAKRKYARRKNGASAPPVGERSSSVAPVVSSQGGLQISEHGDEEEVHMAEPLSILPAVQSIPFSGGAEVGEEEKTE